MFNFFFPKKSGVGWVSCEINTALCGGWHIQCNPEGTISSQGHLYNNTPQEHVFAVHLHLCHKPCRHDIAHLNWSLFHERHYGRSMWISQLPLFHIREHGFHCHLIKPSLCIPALCHDTSGFFHHAWWTKYTRMWVATLSYSLSCFPFSEWGQVSSNTLNILDFGIDWEEVPWKKIGMEGYGKRIQSWYAIF